MRTHFFYPQITRFFGGMARVLETTENTESTEVFWVGSARICLTTKHTKRHGSGFHEVSCFMFHVSWLKLTSALGVLCWVLRADNHEPHEKRCRAFSSFAAFAVKTNCIPQTAYTPPGKQTLVPLGVSQGALITPALSLLTYQRPLAFSSLPFAPVLQPDHH